MMKGRREFRKEKTEDSEREQGVEKETIRQFEEEGLRAPLFLEFSRSDPAM